MSTSDITRPQAGFLSRVVGLFRTRAARKPAPKGKAPAWLNDPELCAQLTRDTGLSREDLAGTPVWDASQPFFMQKNFW